MRLFFSPVFAAKPAAYPDSRLRLYKGFYCLPVTDRNALSQPPGFRLRHLRHIRKRKRYAHRFIFFQTELPERQQLYLLYIRILFQEIHQLYNIFLRVIDARDGNSPDPERNVLLFVRFKKAATFWKSALQ